MNKFWTSLTSISLTLNVLVILVAVYVTTGNYTVEFTTKQPKGKQMELSTDYTNKDYLSVIEKALK